MTSTMPLRPQGTTRSDDDMVTTQSRTGNRTQDRDWTKDKYKGHLGLRRQDQVHNTGDMTHHREHRTQDRTGHWTGQETGLKTEGKRGPRAREKKKNDKQNGTQTSGHRTEHAAQMP